MRILDNDGIVPPMVDDVWAITVDVVVVVAVPGVDVCLAKSWPKLIKLAM